MNDDLKENKLRIDHFSEIEVVSDENLDYSQIFKQKVLSVAAVKPQSLNIADYLLQRGVISDQQLEIAEQTQRTQMPDKDIGKILISLGFITPETLSDILNQFDKPDVLDLSDGNFTIDASLLNGIKKQTLLQYKTIPIDANADSLKVITNDTENKTAFEAIKKLLGQENLTVIPYEVSQDIIAETLDLYYGSTMQIPEILHEIETAQGNLEYEDDGSNRNIYTRLINAIITDAVKYGAAYIHFESEANLIRLRYRIDGIMQQIAVFSTRYAGFIISKLKAMSGVEREDGSEATTGFFELKALCRDVKYTASFQSTAYGEDVVIKICDQTTVMTDYQQAGLDHSHIQLIQKVMEQGAGLILVIGQKESGKTNTVYSILSDLDKRGKSLITLENSIEYPLKMVRQSVVDKAENTTLSQKIEILLKQNPDIAFIDQNLDRAALDSLAHAASSGHQIFSVLREQGVVDALQYLLDLGVQHRSLAQAVKCCIAQLLMRRLCYKCKEEYEATEDELQILGHVANNEEVVKLQRPKGCEGCKFTGYSGQIGVFEVREVTAELAQMINERAGYKQMHDLLYTNKDGKKNSPIQSDAASKVLAGITSIEEFLGVVGKLL